MLVCFYLITLKDSVATELRDPIVCLLASCSHGRQWAGGVESPGARGTIRGENMCMIRI